MNSRSFDKHLNEHIVMGVYKSSMNGKRKCTLCVDGSVFEKEYFVASTKDEPTSHAHTLMVKKICTLCRGDGYY